jgi:YD repeat-containing protein
MSDMLNRPERSFRCGPLALSRILAHLEQSDETKHALAILDAADSTPNGLSLSGVQRMSLDAGMNYQMAFRLPGAALIIPSVAHWNVGHYAALTGKDADDILVEDLTFGEAIRVSTSTLDAESSGYFLVPPGPLPAGWRSVDPSEGDGIWGRGDTGNSYDLAATGERQIHAFPGEPCEGGCTTWNVEAMNVGLSLHDTPLSYHPPIGPDVRITVSYSQRDITQAQTPTLTNMGFQWTMNWISQIQYLDQSGATLSYSTTSCCMSIPAKNFALLYQPGGGLEQYDFYSAPVPTLGFWNNTVLSPITSSDAGTINNIAGFQVLHADGSVDTYTQAEYSVAAPPVNPAQFQAFQGGGNIFLLTSVADPQGNAITVQYDSQLRISSLTDAVNQKTVFGYNISGDPTKVSSVTDPFNRTATFGYDGDGRLTSITDVLGIRSSFGYPETDGGTIDAGASDPLHVDFVTSLTTPYGTTNFSTGEPTGELIEQCDVIQAQRESACSCAQTKRWVQATDPLNQTSRAEYCEQAPNISAVDPIIINGVVLSASNAMSNNDKRSVPVIPAAVGTQLSAQGNTDPPWSHGWRISKFSQYFCLEWTAVRLGATAGRRHVRLHSSKNNALAAHQ